MRILIGSITFHPGIGGIESVSATLANEFVASGHEVKVVTQTPSSREWVYPFEVVRRPAPHTLIGLLHWSDVYLQNHVSLRLAWPLLLVRRPWVVTQANWLESGSGLHAWKGLLKRFLLRFATRVAISRAIAHDLAEQSEVIGNPYDSSTFRLIPDVQRERDLVFLGRLVPEKGADLLLKALGLLKERGCLYGLTVVGGGPDEDFLRLLADELDLRDQIDFVGTQTGVELARTLNAHRILIVPSVWQEPFGVVALEGCACGCIVIGSNGGGLPEALGPCGVTFPNGDVGALADLIEQLSSNPPPIERDCTAIETHLQSHAPRAVAGAYLRIFDSAITRRR